MSHRLSQEKEGEYECMGGCFDSHQARKTSVRPTQERPVSDFAKPVVSSFLPTPLFHLTIRNLTRADRPAGRQEETAASDDLREGWKHGELWVNGRPESPPVRPNQDQ